MHTALYVSRRPLAIVIDVTIRNVSRVAAQYVGLAEMALEASLLSKITFFSSSAEGTLLRCPRTRVVESATEESFQSLMLIAEAIQSLPVF